MTSIQCLTSFLDYTLTATTFSPQTFTNLHVCVRWLSPGVLEFEPLEHDSKQAFLISCGVHGNETAPIELCNDWVRQLALGALKLRHPLLIQFANLKAIKQQKRFLNINMNRLFDEDGLKAKKSAGYEGKRALELQQLSRHFKRKHADKCCVHLDLHCAIRGSEFPLFAIHPYTSTQQAKPELLAFLAQSEINTLVFSNQPVPTYSCFTKLLGYTSVTLELGAAQPFGSNDFEALAPFAKQLEQVLTTMQGMPSQVNLKPERVFYVRREVVKQDENFHFSFKHDIKNFTAFAKGDVLGFQGGQAFCVETAKEWIIFPNAKVKLGERALLLATEQPISSGL